MRVSPFLTVLAILMAASVSPFWAEDPPPPPVPENPSEEPHPPAGLLDPRDFPVGITILAPIATPPEPVPLIKVRTNSDLIPGRTAPILVISLPQFLPLPRPPLAAPKARNLVPSGDWTPTSAWPPGDPERSYRWNPAVFSPAPPPWTPTPAWPPEKNASSWSPVVWAKPVFDPVWTPQDSWGRKPGTEDELQAP